MIFCVLCCYLYIKKSVLPFQEAQSSFRVGYLTVSASVAQGQFCTTSIKVTAALPTRIDFIPAWKFGTAFQGSSNSVIQMGSAFPVGLLTSHGVKGKQFVMGFINRLESQHNPNIT